MSNSQKKQKQTQSARTINGKPFSIEDFFKNSNSERVPTPTSFGLTYNGPKYVIDQSKDGCIEIRTNLGRIFIKNKSKINA